MNKKEVYQEFTVNYKNNGVEIYSDPTEVLIVRRNKKDNKKIVIEINKSLIGRMSINIYPELLKKIIENLK
jgi:hypothetical protein